MGATIANRGWFITPHFARDIEGGTLLPQYTTRRYTTIEEEYYEDIVAGMRSSALSGTCRWLNTMPELEACGKTGTAQNKGKDHGAFVGFAPINKPKIAIAVYVENGGFGATYAVPIGGILMQKYITGKLSPANEEIANAISNTKLHYDYAER
jgi:penicillin-binding protein 2